MEQVTLLSVIGGGITAIILIARWLISREEEKKKRESDRTKEIHDAIASGDVSRINAVIQRMRSK